MLSMYNMVSPVLHKAYPIVTYSSKSGNCADYPRPTLDSRKGGGACQIMRCPACVYTRLVYIRSHMLAVFL